ncbi:sorbosone dehydrogenase [Balneolaceae bacterium YR4-1]|uniref:Sorbosone dehydrogenase n=1 Tax=Halalkalibaculum roseum TaxID=2709311 RepID=A0A6M1T873_9BACT|nr:PQQ-dependent sugar dehydrogenase [Halalkalibaculum roseum]NGP76473.1 sorbosone dehydrogenase [Halalkalibaculum roseum]
MYHKKLSLLLLPLFILASCTQQPPFPADAVTFSENNGGLTLPDGFRASVVADSIGYARHLTVDDDGDIYVVLREPQNGKGIAALRDQDNDGNAEQIEYFSEFTDTGIRLHNGYLYVSTDSSVHRYQMTGDDLIPSAEPQTVISGFPDQSSHAAKSFTFDESGNIYVNVGAPSNACQQESRTKGSPGMEPCPHLERQAGIWKFSADSLNQTQNEDGQRYATGIRNAVALDWNETTDHLYVVQHGRDQLNTLWPDYYTAEDNAALPAEEFFLVNEGDNFGWPYAYYDWQKDQKMVMPEYGGDGETPVEEGEYEDPIMAFPGHWAPNDLLFYTHNHFPERYVNGAFIAFHGSWNRAPEPQQGYKVVFVPFSGETPSGDYEEFATGFPGSESPQPGSAEHRPMGLAQGPDGTLYITDSQKGKVWRVVYTGSETGTGE